MSECILWARALNTRGYGVKWRNGKLHLAHRLAWFDHYGRWPTDGLVIDHMCNVKACVNVEHLREATNSQNIMRAYPRGDEHTEHRRANARAATARYRARLRARAGGSDDLV